MAVIEGIGWEIEGGANRSDVFLQKFLGKSGLRYYDIASDGSVDVSGVEYSSETEVRIGGSPKKVIATGCYLLDEEWVKQNRTCGNHIHVFFKQDDIRDLWTWRNPQERLIKRYQHDFPDPKYRNRLENSYSRWTGYNIARAVMNMDKERGCRYDAINLMSIERHSSIEFRMMPYFENGTEASKAINWLLDTIRYITRTTAALTNSEDFRSVAYRRQGKLQDRCEIENENINKEVIVLLQELVTEVEK